MSIVHAPFWKDVHILKLTINMRLLTQSHEMTPLDHLKAQSFADWLLAIGEGRDNMTPVTELPSGISVIQSRCLH